jgi:hypothetical protein
MGYDFLYYPITAHPYIHSIAVLSSLAMPYHTP